MSKEPHCHCEASSSQSAADAVVLQTPSVATAAGGLPAGSSAQVENQIAPSQPPLLI